MSTRARQSLPSASHDERAPSVAIADPEEFTAHISPETVSRLKAACVEESSAPRPVMGSEPGETFGMVCELSSGTTATVYLAVDRRIDSSKKFVAVKRFLPELTGQDRFTEQFIDEMRLAASVDHPFVCQVRDFGRAGASYYAAMEFLQGQSLDDVLFSPGLRKPATREPRLLARLFANYAEGLHAVHTAAAEDGAEPMHGAVTPRNLFVLFDGAVRVTDFGMSWARDILRRSVQDGGSLDHSYLAPEQLERADLDERVDVWALGVVFWELLTGQKLFRCPTPREATVQITARRIPPPSELNPGISAELDRIVLKALTRQRNRRHRTMLELSNDLERYLAEGGGVVRQTEVAAWIGGLFPAGADRDRGLLEMASVTAERLPHLVDSALELAPLSGAYSPASQDDDVEQTTHIFAGQLKNTMRSAQPLIAPLAVETVSLRDSPITVRRPRRARKSRWRTAIVPFLATFSLGLLGLGAAQTLNSRQQASAPRPSAPALPPPVQLAVPARVAPPAEKPAPPPAAAQRAPVTAGLAQPPAPSAEAHPAAVREPVKALPAKPGGTNAGAQSTPTGSSAGQTGNVFLTTPGGGDVFDRGRFLGRAPGGFELSPGWHTLVIKSGTDNRTATVQVKPSSSVMISVPATAK